MNRHATTRTYRSIRYGFSLFLLLLIVILADISHAEPAQDCAGYYPVYSGSKLTVDKKGVTVNGNLVDEAKGNDYNSIAANGLLQNITLPPPPLPAITPGSFPPNTSNVKIEDAVTVSAGFYKDIIISKNFTTSFNDTGGIYYIDELKIERNGTAIFAPGKYYINDLKLEDSAAISISPSGLVKLYINNQLDMKRNSTMNASGSAVDLQLLIYDNGEYKSDKNVQFKGTIVAPGSSTKVELGDNSIITGGVYSGGEVKWKKNSAQIFTAAEIRASALALGCLLADHFDIKHDTVGINCQAEPVTIEAHWQDHTVSTIYTGTLNLSTSTGNGDWSVITGMGPIINGSVDDGIASYDMVDGDDGVVVLGLKDTTVETVNINVSDGLVMETTGTALSSEDQDLVFAQAGFRFIDAADIAIIDTQIAGKSSSVAPAAQTLYLQAIRSSDDGVSCSGVFANGVTANIDLGSSCSNPVSCLAGQRVSVTNNASTTAIANPQNQDAGSNYSSVPLTFTTGSRAQIDLYYADAGEIQLNARYDIPLADGSASGNIMTGNSNTFAVRPFGFELDFSGDRASNGITGPSYAADANGSTFQIAGASFPVSMAAVAWNSTDDLDNNGVPDVCADLSNNTITNNFGNETIPVTPTAVILSHTLLAPVAGVAGTVSTSASSGYFASGVGSKTIAWNEVGIMDLDATLSSYLGSGQGVSGNVCNVGRFYPDNFVIANPVITNRSDIVACADPFTYMGENFTISYELQATSLNPPGSITQNYINSFAKLDPAVLADMNYAATDNGTNLTARLSAASAGVFTAGVAPVTATLSLTRNATPDGVYDNFQIGAVPADSDGVTLLPAALDLSLNGGPNTHGLLGQTDIRYGRLNLQNNFGSELLTLTMPLSAEYYLNASAEFITNIDDSCTTRTVADILLYNDQQVKAGRAVGDPVINVNGASSTTLTGVSAFAAGQSVLTFTAPGAEGYVDVEVQAPSWLRSDLDAIDQGIAGPGMHCNPALAVSNPAYIAGCVADGNIVDETPLSRGNFGLFKGGDNIIYIREIY
jgi:hypothetical protein